MDIEEAGVRQIDSIQSELQAAANTLGQWDSKGRED